MAGNFALAALALAASAAGITQFVQAKPAVPRSSNEDEIVCVRVEETGSRLKANRVCMTRAQWAEQRRQDRMLIERSQMQACTPNANC